MKVIRFIALLLIVVGAINWGLFGLFQYDLVADLFGGPSTPLARLVYILVGIAGLYGISFLTCKKSSCCGCNHDKNHHHQ